MKEETTNSYLCWSIATAASIYSNSYSIIIIIYYNIKIILYAHKAMAFTTTLWLLLASSAATVNASYHQQTALRKTSSVKKAKQSKTPKKSKTAKSAKKAKGSLPPNVPCDMSLMIDCIRLQDNSSCFASEVPTGEVIRFTYRVTNLNPGTELTVTAMHRLVQQLGATDDMAFLLPSPNPTTGEAVAGEDKFISIDEDITMTLNATASTVSGTCQAMTTVTVPVMQN